MKGSGICDVQTVPFGGTVKRREVIAAFPIAIVVVEAEMVRG